MFESWILVCSVVVPTLCSELRDTEGPYPTEKECVLRNDEMAKFVYERQVFAVEITRLAALIALVAKMVLVRSTISSARVDFNQAAEPREYPASTAAAVT